MINDYDYVYAHAHARRPPTAPLKTYSAPADPNYDYGYSQLMNLLTSEAYQYSSEPKEDFSHDQMINTQDIKTKDQQIGGMDSLETVGTVKKRSEECKKSGGKKHMINPHDFTPRDLHIFVDSVETIKRLQIAKYERRQQQVMKKYQESFEDSRKIITCLDTSMTFLSLGETDHDSNDYYSVPNANNSSNSTSTSTCSNNTYYNIDEAAASLASKQASEESGVFLSHSQESHYYEHIDVDALRSKRCHIISQPKSRSMKSRLASLITKKHHSQPPEKTPSAANKLSPSIFGQHTKNNGIYERVFDDVAKHQYRRNPRRVKNSKRMKKLKRCTRKKRSIGCPEYKFLNRALSLLTL